MRAELRTWMYVSSILGFSIITAACSGATEADTNDLAASLTSEAATGAPAVDRATRWRSWLSRICTKRDGSYNCACSAWFNPDQVDCGAPANVDECATGEANCSADATCTDTPTGFSCACNTGFSGDGVMCTATPTDPCATASNNCSPNATCTSSADTVTCACNSGFEGDGVACTDIDECATANGGCSTNAGCVNTPGGRTCTCNAGFVGDGTSCEPAPVDECVDGANNCSANATCTNTSTGFSCACNAGFSGDGVQCTDIDECASGNGGCSADATCANTLGSHTCTCKPGFVGDGTSCTAEAANECTDGSHNCSANATCSDTAAGFSCACNAGFSGDGVQCADIDECASDNGGCSADATCANTLGSHTCTCKPGFVGDGTSCTVQAVNECTDGSHNCSANATCTDTAASFSCACNAGFSGDGVQCTDINECTSGNGGCSADATCTNTAGSRTCACNSGFDGNGITCTPQAVNECAGGTDNCSPNATCTDTPTSFSCACNDGFQGDGVTCTQTPTQCSLTGSFAVLTETDITWDAVLFSGVTVIEGGSATLRSWSLNDLVQSGSSVSMESQACGDTSPDFCSSLLGQAYSQSVPDSVWQLPTAPHPVSTISLTGGTDPGAPFVGELETTLLGLDLANPSGPWPPTYQDPSITWTDPDADGNPGLTLFMRTTGTSASCDQPYSALPIPSSGELATEVYTGTRSIGQLDASVVDCDTIEGSLKGPGNSPGPESNGHVAGCLKSDGAACTAEETASLDEGGGGAAYRVTATRVTMVRVSDATTCQQVKALTF